MNSKKLHTNVLPFNFDTSTRNEKSEPQSIPELNAQINALKDERLLICEMAAKTILKALDLKDNYTFSHSVRVCYYSLTLAQELQLSPEESYELQLVALFHDIGKIGTPDAVLNKPTRLSDQEFNIIKHHPNKSYEILKDFSPFISIAKAVKHHHERYDGRGYPDQLKGEGIPKLARIVLIADTYDAMISSRVYRVGLPREVAFNELIEFSGSQFDPEYVQKFVIAMRKYDNSEQEGFYIPFLSETFEKKAA